jgi:phage/plasmid-like protein (TIGR03299 family)
MKALGAERKPYFTKVGKDIIGMKSVQDVIKATDLDWAVEKQPIFLKGESEVPNRFATVRVDNNQVLGIVGNNYEVVQNIEGFEFIDDCLGDGIEFVKAGTYNKGERVFIAAKAPSVNICGDEVIPHILFTNSHDGSGTVQAIFTPMRLVCSNGLMLPAEGHESGIVKIKIQHTKNVKDRLMIAKEVILKNNIYIEALKKEAEELLETPFTESQFKALSEELAGIKGVEDEKVTRGQIALVEDLQTAYQEEDIQKFENTAWKAINAVADAESHKVNSRNTGNDEYEFQRVAFGMTMLVTAYQIIARMTGRRR